MKKIILFVSTIFIACMLMGQSNDERNQLKRMINEIESNRGYKDKSYTDQLLILSNIYYRSKEIYYDELVVRCLLQMADLELTMGNIASSLKWITEGMAVAEKLSLPGATCDFLTLKGVALLSQSYFSEGRESINKAFKNAATVPNNDERHYRLMILNMIVSDMYSESNAVWKASRDSTIVYKKRAYQESKKISQSSPYYWEAQIHAWLLLADLELIFWENSNEEKLVLSVESNLLKAEELIKKHAYKDMLPLLYIAKSELAVKKGNIKLAIEYCQLSLPILKHFNNNFDYQLVLKQISSLYGHLKDYELEAHYLKLSVKLADSLHIREKEAIKNSLPYLQNKKSYNYSVEFGIFFAVCVVGGLFIRTRKRSNFTNGQANNIELSASLASPPSELNKEKMTVVIELAKANSELFYLSFLELYPDFRNKLVHVNPQFSLADCEFCALLKLNFDTKQIARYRNLSIRSVDSKKYRIRKKLGLSPEEDIYLYFLEF